MKNGKLENLGFLAAVTAIMVCFASNSVITRYLVLGSYASPFNLTVTRFGSGLIMLHLLSIMMPTLSRTLPKVAHVPGAFFLGVYAFSISYGYYFISSSAGVLIFYTFVVFTMTLFSVLNDKERLTARLILGVFLGIIGVLVITASGISSVTLTGAFLMASTGASWGMYCVYGRRFENSFDYTYNSFLLFVVAALTLSVMVTPFLARHEPLNRSTWHLFLELYMGMISTALSYVLWNRFMTKLSASQGGLTQLIVPVLTALIGIVLLGEESSLALLFGGILIITGIFLNNR